MNSIRMNRKLVSFEAFSSELAERVHRPLLRSKRGKHLSSHDSTTLLVASEVLSYLLHQLDEKGRDVESVLGATSADTLEEVYGILLGEFPDSGLLQERDSRKMKFTKISEATFEEYGLHYSLPLVQKLLGELEDALMTRVEYTAFLTAVRIPENKSRHFVLRLLLDKLAPQKLEVLKLLIGVLQRVSVEDDGRGNEIGDVIEKCGRAIFQSNEVSSDRTIINRSDILAAEQCLKMLLEEGQILRHEGEGRLGKFRQTTGAEDVTRNPSRRPGEQPSRLRRRRSFGGSPKSYSAIHMKRVMMKKGEVHGHTEGATRRSSRASPQDKHVSSLGKENLESPYQGQVGENYDISEANLGNIRRYFLKTPTTLISKTRSGEKNASTMKVLAQSVKNVGARLEVSGRCDPKRTLRVLSSPKGEVGVSHTVEEAEEGASQVGMDMIDPKDYSKYLIGLPKEVLDKIKLLSKNAAETCEAREKETGRGNEQSPGSSTCTNWSGMLEKIDMLMSSPDSEEASSRSRSSLSPSSARLKSMLAELTPSPENRSSRGATERGSSATSTSKPGNTESPKPDPSGKEPEASSKGNAADISGSGKRETTPKAGKVKTARKKMKALHWQKLHKTKTKKTVWETERSDFGLNVEELESLFSLGEKPVKKVEKKKSSKVHLVGLKRSHNISIELSGMKLDFSRIRNSLLDMDDSQFSLEQLHVLKRAVPTEQESTKLRNYSGDKSKLGQVELYFMEVMSIPRLENRIDSLIYKKTFVSCIDKLKEELSILKQASSQVLGSNSLKLILEGVLAVGNYMNTGTSRGSADGFKIESLLKLKDIKGKDRKTSLLHFIVKELIKKEDKVRFFTAEIEKVVAASKFQKDYVSHTLQQLEAQQGKLKEEILHASVVLDDTSDLNDRFRDVMVPFAEDSEETLTCMKSILGDTVANLEKMRDFLGEDQGTEPNETFRTLRDFMQLYDSVICDIREAEKIEEQKKRAEMRAARRERSKSVCVATPPTPVEGEKLVDKTNAPLPGKDMKVRARSMSVCPGLQTSTEAQPQPELEISAPANKETGRGAEQSPPRSPPNAREGDDVVFFSPEPVGSPFSGGESEDEMIEEAFAGL